MQEPNAKIVDDALEAAEWVAGAMESSGYHADFSPKSAWEVDRFFADQMTGPGEPNPKGLLAEGLGPRLFALGSYVGETVRRNAAGWQWVPAEGNPDDEMNLALKRDGDTIWPIQRVMKRYAEGEENGIAAYVMAVADLEVGPRPEPSGRRRWFRRG